MKTNLDFDTITWEELIKTSFHKDKYEGTASKEDLEAYDKNYRRIMDDFQARGNKLAEQTKKAVVELLNLSPNDVWANGNTSWTKFDCLGRLFTCKEKKILKENGYFYSKTNCAWQKNHKDTHPSGAELTKS